MSEHTEIIRDTPEGVQYFFNMVNDGGAMVVKCVNMYLLFEIPLYGGQPQYYSTYGEHEIDKLVRQAESWT